MERTAGPYQAGWTAQAATAATAAGTHAEPGSHGPQQSSPVRPCDGIPCSRDVRQVSGDLQREHAGPEENCPRRTSSAQTRSPAAAAVTPVGEHSLADAASDAAHSAEDPCPVGEGGPELTDGLCSPSVAPVSGMLSRQAAARDGSTGETLQPQHAPAGGMAATYDGSWQPGAEARPSRDPRLAGGSVSAAMPQVAACDPPAAVEKAGVGSCSAPAAAGLDSKPAVVGLLPAGQPSDGGRLPVSCTPATPMAAAQEPPVSWTAEDTSPVQPSALSSPAVPQSQATAPQGHHTLRNIVLAVRCRLASALILTPTRSRSGNALLSPNSPWIETVL